MTDVTWVSPWQKRRGRWYKREDLYRVDAGVNGSKLRACAWLIGNAADAGAKRVISAASVLSPQHAMASVLADRFGMDCTVIIGGTKPDSAMRHRSLQIAVDHGAEVDAIRVGYNPALQSRAAVLAADDPGAYWLPYGITTPPSATTDELRAFHTLAAEQTRGLPDDVRTLVVPFGSGNTGTGVMMGLAQYRHLRLERIVLVAIGPDRRTFMKDRLDQMGIEQLPYEYIDLHGSGYATYSDRMPWTAGGIILHPTYEGKVVRYLDEQKPDWWADDGGRTALWIVGGPLG